MSDVAFLGLGTMGAGMARRLIDAGHRVVVWNRSAAAAEPLVAAGAIAAASPAEALGAGIAFSMLANDKAADAVFSDETLAASAGAAHVNMATVSTEAARALQARHERFGVSYAAAPVLGRPNLAATGMLSIVTAGAPEVLERAAPFLDVMGQRTWNVGEDPAQANLVKIGVNYNLIHALQAMAESINLIERGGVDGGRFVEILTDTAFTGRAYTGYGPMIAERAYSPAGFAMELGLKDLNLARSAGVELGAALPTVDVLSEIFAEALADPQLAEFDWSGMAEITRRRSA
jgi:3-hydroxyisobutyrate dehydrogenase-like beta-hydroxyacid dehydrogenase